jgi:hypothetical protein
MILNPGESASVPLRTNHRFYNSSDSEEVEFIVRIDPGIEGFERGLYIVYGLAEDGLTDSEGVPSSLLHLATFTRLTTPIFLV